MTMISALLNWEKLGSINVVSLLRPFIIYTCSITHEQHENVDEFVKHITTKQLIVIMKLYIIKKNLANL